MKIIGITGHAGSGKDTLATRLLCRASKGGVKTDCLSIAEPMKRSLANLLDMCPGKLNDRELKEETATIARHLSLSVYTHRDLMQRYADAIRRAFGEEFWLEELSSRVEETAKYGVSLAVVPDIRLDYEVVYLRAWCKKMHYGFCLVKIERPGVERANAHRLEDGIHQADLIDHRVRNSGTKADLAKRAELLLYTEGIIEGKDL